MAHYTALVVSRRAPVLIFGIQMSEFCVYALIYFLLSALVGGPAGFSSNFIDIEGISDRE